jgi:hypothetical protein
MALESDRTRQTWWQIHTHRDVDIMFLNIKQTKINQRHRMSKVENETATQMAIVRLLNRFVFVLNNQQVAKRLAIGVC